jgi:hypothetical protein
MNTDNPAPEPRGDRGAIHPNAELVAVVQCEGFRCMARRDAENVWREFHSGKVLPEIKEVVFVIPN